MVPAPAPEPPHPARPSLPQIFLAFFRIGSLSFGGGMSAWIRREMVVRHGWLEDRQFLAGLALSQITPGANGVNMAVFAGTVLRGLPGALAAFFGLMALPACLLVALGGLYFSARGGAIDMWLGKALTGVAAAAIGLVLANGIRLARRNLKGWAPTGITVATAVAIGVFRLNLLPVLAVVIPASLIVAWWSRRA